MITNPVEFPDAVLDQAVNFPEEGAKSSTRIHMHATFTSQVAAALGLQHLKDCAEDAKGIPLKTVCKSFHLRANVPGLHYDLAMHGNEAKQFRLVFPEKEQPRIHFCLYATAKGRDWADYADTVGTHPAVLTLTPLQGELLEDEADETEDRVYPQKELDGSYPFALAKRMEFNAAKASATLYALEIGAGEWLFGWEYRYLTAAGREKIEVREEMSYMVADDAFQAAAEHLAKTLAGFLPTATKKEREQIDAICEWLQPIIEGEPEPDIAEAVMEAMDAE